MRGLRTLLASLLLLGPVHSTPGAEPIAPSMFGQPPVAIRGSELQVDGRMPWLPYPILPLLGKIQGVVRLRILVGPHGFVLGAKALDGPRELLGPAEADVQNYRFKPVLVHGKAVCAVTEIGLPYSLKSEHVDPAGKAVTGFMLHIEADVPSWAGKVNGEFVRREAEARLGALGLELRDPATADPAATLDLTLNLKGKNIAGNPYLDLNSRVSLAAYRKAEENPPGEPKRVWKLQNHAYVTPKEDVEKSCRDLLASAIGALLPGPGNPADGLAFLLHEGDPAAGALAWDPVKVAAYTATHREVDFDFSSIRIRHQPPAPPYPVWAKIARIQGTVIVELTVDPTGTPLSARAVDGPEALRDTAVDYALNWRFEPVLLDGIPQTVRFCLTMPFHLK